MKRFIAFLTVTIMIVCSVSLYASAGKSSFLGEAKIPYAADGVTFDGSLSDWANAAKFELPANKMSPVSGTPASGMYIDVYMMWDETYLYVASEVNDTNNGRLVMGKNGDTLSLFLDIDETIAGLENKRVAKEVTIANNQGIVRQSGFKIVSFPVSAEAGNDTAVGFITKYGADNHEDCASGENLKLIGTDAACSSSGTKWIIEQRVKWTDLKSLYDGIYGTFEMAMPGIKAGTVVTFMPSYNDCGSANTQVGWYLGKNGALEAVQINPVSYGFKGTLEAKSGTNPETKPTPDTADVTLTVGIVVSAIALAGVSVAVSKKKH